MMETYRLYPLDKKGMIASFPHKFLADGDEQALRFATEKMDGDHGELWRGPRRVARLSTDPVMNSGARGEFAGSDAGSVGGG